MAKPETFVIDLDGTAIDSPRTQLPTERLVRAIRTAQKTHNVSAATGRVWSFARPVVQALNLVDPCIVSAGTQIRDPQTGDVLWQQNIEPAQVDAIFEVLKSDLGYKVLYNDYDEDTYFRGHSMPIERVPNEPVYFLGLIFVPDDEAAGVVARFSHISGVTCTYGLAQRPGYTDVLITHENATKEHAVAKLLDILGVDRESTTGVGDGRNDLHLFNAVATKVAMGNAAEELKAAADLIIGSVENDGLAEYLETESFI